MREALALMRLRSKQLQLKTRHPERSFWWHMANEWEAKIWQYEAHNRLAKNHPQIDRKILLPGNCTPYYYMSRDIIRMLSPHVSGVDTRHDD